VEYANNVSMTGAVAGTGAKVSLVPGSDRYFRKKATASSFRSAVQTLTVPSRPAVPSFTIDYNAETIAENVSADFEYSTNASMSGATAGTGSKPALVPGTNLYIQGKATASQFASAVQTLVVNNRPSSPAYTINYIAETTNEPVSAGDEYAASAAMTGPPQEPEIPLRWFREITCISEQRQPVVLLAVINSNWLFLQGHYRCCGFRHIKE